MSAISRGEVIDGIDDHGSSEYIRRFQQVVINSRVPLLEKAVSAFGDAAADSLLKVRGRLEEGLAFAARRHELRFTSQCFPVHICRAAVAGMVF